MKKLMIICYTMLFSILLILSDINFSDEILSQIDKGKQRVTIEKPDEIANTQFVDDILHITDELQTDIMYRYVQNQENTIQYYYYKTGNTNRFVDKKYQNLLKNITFHKWEDIINYDLTSGIYYIDEAKCDEIISEINKVGYKASLNTGIVISGYTSVILFAAIPAFLMIMSIIFYVLSIGKKNVLRKMEGFSTFNIINNELKDYAKIFALILFLLEFLDIVIMNLIYGKAVYMFVLYEMKYLFGGFLICGIGIIVAGIIISFQNKQEYIKGHVQKKGIYIITMLARIIFMIFIVFFMSIAVRNIKLYYNTYKSVQFINEKTKGYVTIPIYENSASSSGMEDNYLDFYKKTVSKYNGVLIYAGNYAYDITTGTTLAESVDQDCITVNENYLKINPVYDIEGNAIEITNKDDVYVLLPISKENEKEKYDEYVKKAYSVNPTFASYDNDNSVIYSYNANIGNSANGKLDEPIIIVINEKHLLGVMAYSYCSSDSYFVETNSDDPYKELKPVLSETGILPVTPQTPYISTNFSKALDEQFHMLILYCSQSLILTFGLICLVVFSGVLYCENYKDKIVIKLVEGYTLTECLMKHYVCTIFLFVLSIILSICVGNIMDVSMNYNLILVGFVFDIIFSYIVCKKNLTHKIHSTLKGEA